MTRASDVSGLPGEMVTVRGTRSIDIWSAPTSSRTHSDSSRVGTVAPGSLGVIVSNGAEAAPGWTYVLWTTHKFMGWVHDGVLRRVAQRG